MLEKIVEDIITGGIIGAVVTAIFSYFNLKFSYKKLFAESVSKNRMDWMNIWRENLATLIGCAESLHNKCSGKVSDEYIKYENEFYKARNAIISRLNMQEEKHVLMFGALNNFDYTEPDEDFEKKKAYIIELARAILKPEWERFKDEARGKEK